MELNNFLINISLFLFIGGILFILFLRIFDEILPKCEKCKKRFKSSEMNKVTVQDPLSAQYGDFHKYYCKDHSQEHDLVIVSGGKYIKAKK